MKVKELIELLQGLPQESEVYISIDPEGNGFNKLENHDTGKVSVALHSLSSYYSDQHSDATCCLEPGERDSMIPIVVLWP